MIASVRFPPSDISGGEKLRQVSPDDAPTAFPAIGLCLMGCVITAEVAAPPFIVHGRRAKEKGARESPRSTRSQALSTMLNHKVAHRIQQEQIQFRWIRQLLQIMLGRPQSGSTLQDPVRSKPGGCTGHDRGPTGVVSHLPARSAADTARGP